MEHLEHPSRELWDERHEWFEAIDARNQGEGAYLLSEQACALTADVEAAFCAGAWAGVIILAMAVVDASLREAERPGFKGNVKDLITAAGATPQLQTLRTRRNALVHVHPDRPALTVDQQWLDRKRLEAEARTSC